MHDVHRGDAAISEIQVLVLDSAFHEVRGVVGLVVESYDGADS